MEEPINTPISSSKPSSNKLFKILIIIIGLLIVIGLFLNAYLLFKKTKPITPTPISVIPTSTPIISETANWKTFISNFGYSVRIPSDMTIGETGFGKGEPEKAEGVRIYQSEVKEPLLSPHMDIIVIPSLQKSLQESAQDNYNQSINHKYTPALPVEKIHESSFLGKKSYEYTLKNKVLVTPHEEYSTPEDTYKIIWVQEDNTQIAVFLNNIPKLNLILSTFKFTGLATDANANWKKYENKKYKYSLDVPNNLKVSVENETQDSATERTILLTDDYNEDKSKCLGGCSFPVVSGSELRIGVQRNWIHGFDKEFFKSLPLKNPGILFEDDKVINGIRMLITQQTRADLPDLGNTNYSADFVNNDMWFNLGYSVGSNERSSQKENFYKILSTFRFD